MFIYRAIIMAREPSSLPIATDIGPTDKPLKHCLQSVSVSIFNDAGPIRRHPAHNVVIGHILYYNSLVVEIILGVIVI